MSNLLGNWRFGFRRCQAGVEPHYKVQLIEEEFKLLMFDVVGVWR